MNRRSFLAGLATAPVAAPAVAKAAAAPRLAAGSSLHATFRNIYPVLVPARRDEEDDLSNCIAFTSSRDMVPAETPQELWFEIDRAKNWSLTTDYIRKTQHLTASHNPAGWCRDRDGSIWNLAEITTPRARGAVLPIIGDVGGGP